jgi:hypothetical protein
VVALYVNDVLVTPEQTLVALAEVIVGKAFIVTAKDEIELTHPLAFFTVRFPVYVPPPVPAGTLIVIGLAGKAASVTAAKLFAGDAFQVIL